MDTISFIIPVYRNQGMVARTHETLLALLGGALSELDYEFIFVDDGSDDDSLSELVAIQNRDAHVRVISFSRNFGQVPAIVAGLRDARGQVAVVMSADLQDPPELVVRMLQEWRAGAQVVICYREDREDTLVSRVTSRLFYGLIHMLNPRMPPGGFDFLLLSREAIDELNKIDERNRFLQGDILWLGFRTRFLPYDRRRRTVGRSQWTTSKKVKYFIDGLLNTSYWPIRAMSLLGIVTAACGFLYSLVIAWAWLTHRTPFQGWAPIMILVLVVGGLNMIMLGIVGEYIWRIYDEVRGRAPYVVQRRIPEGVPGDSSELRSG